MNILSFDGKDIHINGKTAFYFWETYGFPPEVFEEHVNGLLKDPELKKINIALALKEYNNANRNRDIGSNNR